MVASNLTVRHEMPRLGRSVRRDGLAHDVVVAHQPIVGMLHDDAERLLSEMLAPGPLPAPASGNAAVEAGWAAASVRHCLQVDEGDGYWDFYRPWTGLILSVTDATYRDDTWVNVEGTGYFKLRILISGVLRAHSGEIIARAPDALLYVSPGASREGYYIAAGEHTRMIVLHCRPQLLTHVLGLNPKSIPAPLSSVLSPDRNAARRRMMPSPEMIQVARRIMTSRHSLSPALRERYLQTLSMQLMLDVLGILDRGTPVPGASAVSSRDAARIQQAQDYLAGHYVDPPNIIELSRRVGLNCTKLKESFRQIVGFTIYEYILHLRMERAAEMLVTGNYDVAQVAYAVGYEYPANFTAAFKRHFGLLPREWRRRQLSTEDSIQ